MDYRTPMHIQLREILREKIEEGEYKIGEKIPSERELAQVFGLTRMTARNAISSLVKEGLLQREAGRGTFVIRSRIRRDLDILSGFSKAMIEKGIQPESKIIASEIRPANTKYCKIFNIPPMAKLYRICRLRYGNGEPIALEDTYIPYDLVLGVDKLDFKRVSLYALFEAQGIKLEKSIQTLTIAKVGDMEARLLKVPPETDVFLFEYTSIDVTGRVVEYTKSYTRGDKSIFNTVLH